MVKEHDVVALKTDLPKHRLKRGDIGAAVLVYPDGELEVEFVTFGGDTVALVHLRVDQIRRVGKNELPQSRLTGSMTGVRKAKLPARRQTAKRLRAG